MAVVIRVAIVEDHPATAERIAVLLEREPDLAIVGAAPDLDRARDPIRSEMPDVVLCDVELAEGGRDLISSRRPSLLIRPRLRSSS